MRQRQKEASEQTGMGITITIAKTQLQFKLLHANTHKNVPYSDCMWRKSSQVCYVQATGYITQEKQKKQRIRTDARFCRKK